MAVRKRGAASETWELVCHLQLGLSALRSWLGTPVGTWRFPIGHKHPHRTRASDRVII